MKTLPIKISLAVAQYCVNVHRHHNETLERKMGEALGHFKSQTIKPWDKLADLDNITKAAHNCNYHFCASAGSFWFHKTDKRPVLYTSTTIYPQFRKVERVGQIE